MVTDTRTARELEALREQMGSHMQPGSQPNARAMNAEEAFYTEPEGDPQWIDAYKMFRDQDGLYGVPCKLPRGQCFIGGQNDLMNQRRPEGGPWFTLTVPLRLAPEGKFACFVGECTKKLARRIMIVAHVRAFHADEAEVHKVILTKIEQKVAQEDPRLQALLASMEEPEIAADATLCKSCGAAIEGKLKDHLCAEEED